MAARQAQIHVANEMVSLRDLNSPGGTFVDRRRVPPNSDLPLNVGNVIQLGGVQLRLTRGQPVAAAPLPAGFVFALKSGGSCRSWDDFLTVSAQKWGDLRDELTSGRLASYLASAGLGPMVPDPTLPGTPDERLDAWLARLPTTRSAAPELEVHPKTLVLRAPTGGGVVRAKVRVSNAGYRMLRATARVVPPCSWLTLAREFAAREFATLDGIDLAMDASVPPDLASPLVGEVEVGGNGGSAKVTVRVEPAASPAIEPSKLASPTILGRSLRARLEGLPASTRLATWPLGLAVARLLVAVGRMARSGWFGQPAAARVGRGVRGARGVARRAAGLARGDGPRPLPLGVRQRRARGDGRGRGRRGRAGRSKAHSARGLCLRLSCGARSGLPSRGPRSW